MTAFLIMIGFSTQSSATSYGIVDSTREGTARFLVISSQSPEFQFPTAAQLLMMMQMDPYTAPLLQHLSLAIPSGNEGAYRSIMAGSLSALPPSTSVRVSTNEDNSHHVENLVQRYNKIESRKDSPKAEQEALKDRQKVTGEFQIALQSCQKEIRNPRFGLSEKDVLSNWMFLRRRLDIVSTECKSAILRSGGIDLAAGRVVENRPQQIQGSPEFTRNHYGPSITGGAK